jgi:hypothetical protein
MRSTPRTAIWFCLIGLACLVLLSCQLTQSVVEQPSPTPPPTDTPLPSPTDTPTQPPTPTDTPLPPPTETATTIPSPTLPPPPTEIPPTDTPSITLLTVENNLGQKLEISLAGPENRTFSVRARSTFTIEIQPGVYTYQMEAQGFYPETGTLELPPGPFTWTWGKANP